MREILIVIIIISVHMHAGIIAGLTTSLVLNVLIIVAIILLLLIFFKRVRNRNSSQTPNQALYPEGNNNYYIIPCTLCNRYCMVGSVLWIIKPMTPRAQPEGEGLYNP